MLIGMDMYILLQSMTETVVGDAQMGRMLLLDLLLEVLLENSLILCGLFASSFGESPALIFCGLTDCPLEMVIAFISGKGQLALELFGFEGGFGDNFPVCLTFKSGLPMNSPHGGQTDSAVCAEQLHANMAWGSTRVAGRGYVSPSVFGLLVNAQHRASRLVAGVVRTVLCLSRQVHLVGQVVFQYAFCCFAQQVLPESLQRQVQVCHPLLYHYQTSCKQQSTKILSLIQNQGRG